MGGDVVHIEGLVKTFGHTRALDGLDLQVAQGQVHGFLGPNGAGKSTTLRILLGLLRADAGTVRLLGAEPWGDTANLHRRLAHVPGDVALWPNLTGGEIIDVLTRSRGTVDRARRDHLVERFRLDPRAKARTYSKGNRQKVALVAALACPVDLLLLDEPTSGLDPLMEQVFVDEVRRARDEGATVLLSSHELSQVEQLCDHVSIVRTGRRVQTGTLDDLRHLHSTRVRARLADAHRLAALPGVRLVRQDRDQVELAVEDPAMPAVLTALGAEGATNVTAAPPSLEELFLEQYEPASDADRPGETSHRAGASGNGPR